MKKHVNLLILGAGPAGLTLGRCLLDRDGKADILILEKESVAGGLCRSADVDGSPFDIGGGHFLDAGNKTACDFAFRFLPQQEWNLFVRDSRILLGEYEISHPLEANIWQFPQNLRNEYLESIKLAGCNSGAPMPKRFVEWIRWKLGDKIADDYMLPYNRKMFADDLNELGTYWLNKLPDVSYEDTLRSIEEHKSYAKQPGHARFYYPKEYGYGELFLRIADSMSEHIVYDTAVKRINLEKRYVITSNGDEYHAEQIVSTIPWSSMESEEDRDNIADDVSGLRSSSIETRYVSNCPDTEAHWIYVPDPSLPYHRILCRENFLPGSRGCWLETRAEKTPGFVGTKYEGAFSYVNEYAYPINTIDKPERIKRILSVAAEHGITGLGRWGEHEHFNSDVVMEKAMKLAESIVL